jgi:hypothetical protein
MKKLPLATLYPAEVQYQHFCMRDRISGISFIEDLSECCYTLNIRPSIRADVSARSAALPSKTMAPSTNHAQTVHRQSNLCLSKRPQWASDDVHSPPHNVLTIQTKTSNRTMIRSKMINNAAAKCCMEKQRKGKSILYILPLGLVVDPSHLQGSFRGP